MVLLKPLDAAEKEALDAFLTDVAHRVDAVLRLWLPEWEGDEKRVWECMRYSTFAGGKRLRPALVVAAARALSGDVLEGAVWAGAAMEMIHTYSLMQDDLPCMDNDDLRRGKPTAHKHFDEATALLASDGLQTMAYELLADPQVHADPLVRLELIRLFARSSGAAGMVAGQMVDMQWEWDKPTVDVAALARMNRLKTGMNLEACCEAGAILAAGNGPLRAVLRAYGAALGASYQVYDDVLDVVGTTESLGKTPGKDAKAGKTTFVSLLGLEEAKMRAQQLGSDAVKALDGLGEEAGILRLLARYCVTREK